MYEKWSTRDRGSKLDENWIFQFFSYEFQLRITQIVSRSFDLSNIVIHIFRQFWKGKNHKIPRRIIHHPALSRVWIIARIYSRDRILIGVRNTCLSLSLSRGRLIADDPDILEIRPWNWLSKLARDSKKSYVRIATSPLATLFTLLSLFVVSSQLTALVTPL